MWLNLFVLIQNGVTNLNSEWEPLFHRLSQKQGGKEKKRKKRKEKEKKRKKGKGKKRKEKKEKS